MRSITLPLEDNASWVDKLRLIMVLSLRKSTGTERIRNYKIACCLESEREGLGMFPVERTSIHAAIHRNATPVYNESEAKFTLHVVVPCTKQLHIAVVKLGATLANEASKHFITFKRKLNKQTTQECRVLLERLFSMQRKSPLSWNPNAHYHADDDVLG
jgi:hypothetical protein